MDHIPSDRLTLADIPGPDADWSVISQFALTFDGYTHCGSFEKCAEIAIARAARTLDEFRTCLFFEQRRFRHFGWDPEGNSLAYIRSLVEEIRARVAARG